MSFFFSRSSKKPILDAGGAASAHLVNNDAEIVVIPEKFYGVALKMDSSASLLPPEPPKPTLTPAPLTTEKIPAPTPGPAHSSRIPFVLVVCGFVCIVVGGFIFFNRRLLFSSPSSSSPTATPPVMIQPPIAPTNLVATSSGMGIALTWQDLAGNESGFRIERRDSDMGYLPLTTVPQDTSAFLDVSAQAGKAYMYRVLAINAGGESSPSNETAAVTLALSASPPSNPLPPGGLDSDSDGLTDVEEAVYGTNPQNPDTDADGFLDGNEVYHLYNPAGKAPLTLADTGLVVRWSLSTTSRWSVLIPKNWHPVLTENGRARIETGKGETIDVVFMPHATSTIDGMTHVWITKTGLEGKASDDQLTAIFSLGDMDLRMVYQLNGQPFINFRRTFEMIVNSLTRT